MKTTIRTTTLLTALIGCLLLSGCIFPNDRGGYGYGGHRYDHSDGNRGDGNRGDDHGYQNRGNGYGN